MTQPQRRRVRPFPFDQLPRLSRVQLEVARAMLEHLPLAPGAAWVEACAALGGPVTLSLVEAEARPFDQLPALARGALVRLRLPGSRWALIVLDPRLAPRLCRRALGLDTDELPAPRPLTVAEEGALEWLVAALVDEPTAALSDGVVREGDPAAPASAKDAWLWVLQARLQTPVGEGWARLVAPESVRHAAAEPRPHHAWREAAARLAEADVTLRLEVGRTTLHPADLASLSVEDVVMFERMGIFGGTVSLRLGRGGFAARLEGDALTVVDGFRIHSGAMHMDDEGDKAGTNQLLRELPVEVACELGRVTMSGRELLELRPGAVIPVGRPLSGPVDLVVGGRVVARGELVDVEGEIGVRITQIVE